MNEGIMVEITDELRRGIDPNDIAGAEKLMSNAADLINMLRATWAEAEAERDRYHEMWESNAKATAAMANRALTAEGKPFHSAQYYHDLWMGAEKQLTQLAAALAARAGSKPEGDGWQPIETAPKDGKRSFLVLYQSGDIQHVYLTEPAYPLAQTFRHAGGPMRGEQAGWPTHWRPLPIPPQSDATTAAMGTTNE